MISFIKENKLYSKPPLYSHIEDFQCINSLPQYQNQIQTLTFTKVKVSNWWPNITTASEIKKPCSLTVNLTDI